MWRQRANDLRIYSCAALREKFRHVVRTTFGLAASIENVVIDGFTKHGINVGATGSKVFVKGATVRRVLEFGINLEPGGNAPNASLWVDSSSLLGCRAGIFTGVRTRATIRDSALMGNETGLAAEKSDVMAVNCVFGENGKGVVSRQGSTIRLSLATVTNNQVGLAVDAGGKIISFKNNVVHGNVQDGAVSTTVLPI
ncbi:MAG: right-handed parallel beta-helix repeat-containing protein [Pyrinomonadaceae bacterium]